MAKRICVHVGAPKSGTTYIQTILWANQQRMRDGGVLLPGERKREHDLMAGWVRNSKGTAKAGERLAAQMREWPGLAILSSEWFTLADPKQVDSFIEAVAPSEVEVVFTARRFAAAAPAAWQQTLKSGLSTSLEDFIRSMDRPENRWGWATLDPAEVLPRWEAVVPADRVHVVTGPLQGADRSLLWQRFAKASGLEDINFDLEHAVPNESMSAEGARLLQILGPELRSAVDADRLGWRVPQQWIRQYFSEGLLLPQPGHAFKVEQPQIDILHARARKTVAALEASGYDVVGDLDELLDVSMKSNTLLTKDVGADALLQLTLKAIPPMLRRMRSEHETAAKYQKRVKAVEKERDELKAALDAAQRSATATGAAVATSPPAQERIRHLWSRVQRKS